MTFSYTPVCARFTDVFGGEVGWVQVAKKKRKVSQVDVQYQTELLRETLLKMYILQLDVLSYKHVNSSLYILLIMNKNPKGIRSIVPFPK